MRGGERELALAGCPEEGRGQGEGALKELGVIRHRAGRNRARRRRDLYRELLEPIRPGAGPAPNRAGILV